MDTKKPREIPNYYLESMRGMARCFEAIEMKDADQVLESASRVYKDTVKKLAQDVCPHVEEHHMLKKAIEDFFARYEAYAREHNKRFKRLV